MTFGQSYLTHMKCLENVGMLSTTPIEFQGQQIVPIQFLKALLPDPASLGPRTVGKTNIGCIFTGRKDGKEKTLYIYNVCDHQACYKELGSQAISYTTGVPAMIGTMMVAKGLWKKPRRSLPWRSSILIPIWEALNQWGLPWVVEEHPALVELMDLYSIPTPSYVIGPGQAGGTTAASSPGSWSGPAAKSCWLRRLLLRLLPVSPDREVSLRHHRQRPL